MSTPLNDLPDALRKLESGARGLGTMLTIEDRVLEVPNAAMLAILLKHFGFAHTTAALHPISREDASALISHLVAYDQAYGCPTEALSIAFDCGVEFVALFPIEAQFFTNSSDRIDTVPRSWDPLTTATFDSGVIGVAPTRVGMIWFEDED